MAGLQLDEGMRQTKGSRALALLFLLGCLLQSTWKSCHCAEGQLGARQAVPVRVPSAAPLACCSLCMQGRGGGCSGTAHSLAIPSIPLNLDFFHVTGQLFCSRDRQVVVQPEQCRPQGVPPPRSACHPGLRGAVQI